MRIAVDRTRCQGHARYTMTTPEVFGLDAASYVLVKLAQPPHFRDAVRRAVEGCPEHALACIEDKPGESSPAEA